MIEHVKMLGWLAIVRSVVACNLAVYCYLRSRTQEFRIAAEPLDAEILRIAIVLLLVLGVLRLVQGIGALLSLFWARLLGLGFAIFDLCNLVFFPVSTGLGLYALVTYRHAETIDHFNALRASRSTRGAPAFDHRLREE